MSVLANIRDIADKTFTSENRSVALGIAIGFALGAHFANQTSSNEENYGSVFTSRYLASMNSTLSTVNEHILFDVRSAKRICEQTYTMMMDVKSSPFKLPVIESGNFANNLFKLDVYYKEEELAILNQYHQAIAQIAEQLNVNDEGGGE